MTRRGIRLLACSVVVLVAANLFAPRAVAGEVEGATRTDPRPTAPVPVIGLYGF